MYWISYEVLSDSNKRSVYDQAGKAGLESGGGMGGGMDPQDLFSQLFGGGGGFFGGGGGELICPSTRDSQLTRGFRRSESRTSSWKGPSPPYRCQPRGFVQGQSAKTRIIKIGHLQVVRRTRRQERRSGDMYIVSWSRYQSDASSTRTDDAANSTTM